MNILHRFCDICPLIIIIINNITISSTALGGSWLPQAIVASNLYRGHPPADFYNPVSLCLPLPPSIHLDFGRPRPRPAGFVHNIYLGNLLLCIRTTWPAHLSLLDFITLTVLCDICCLGAGMCRAIADVQIISCTCGSGLSSLSEASTRTTLPFVKWLYSLCGLHQQHLFCRFDTFLPVRTSSLV